MNRFACLLVALVALLALTAVASAQMPPEANPPQPAPEDPELAAAPQQPPAVAPAQPLVVSSAQSPAVPPTATGPNAPPPQPLSQVFRGSISVLVGITDEEQGDCQAALQRYIPSNVLGLTSEEQSRLDYQDGGGFVLKSQQANRPIVNIINLRLTLSTLDAARCDALKAKLQSANFSSPPVAGCPGFVRASDGISAGCTPT